MRARDFVFLAAMALSAFGSLLCLDVKLAFSQYRTFSTWFYATSNFHQKYGLAVETLLDWALFDITTLPNVGKGSSSLPDPSFGYALAKGDFEYEKKLMEYDFSLVYETI